MPTLVPEAEKPWIPWEGNRTSFADRKTLVDRSCVLEHYTGNMEATLNNTNSGSDPKPPVIYRCKKCRRIVAIEEHVVPHDRGEGQKCFKWKKRNADSDMDAPECSSIFVEPMKWMQAVEEGCVEDKLHCFGCKARLGSFNWAGIQCNCGTWINPAFQLHKNRIDESHV